MRRHAKIETNRDVANNVNQINDIRDSRIENRARVIQAREASE